MSTRRILLIPGSLRAGSYTTQLLRHAGALAPPGWDAVEYDAVRSVPYYDADVDLGDDAPDAIRTARATVRAADALIIATPEYNGALPGGLKNWVDWITRPMRAHALIAKPIAVLGASPGPGGAKRAVGWLGTVLPLLGARVAPVSPMIGDVVGHLDGGVDATVSAQIAEMVTSLIDLAETPIEA